MKKITIQQKISASIGKVLNGELALTEDNYKQVIDTATQMQSTVQDLFQLTIKFGIDHAQKDGHNSFDVWNYCLIKATSSYGKGLRHKSMAEYICALMGNTVKYTKDKNGEFKFMKASKKTKVDYSKATGLIATNWYDYGKDAEPKSVNVSGVSKAKAMLKALLDAEKGDNNKTQKSDDAEANAMLAKLLTGFLGVQGEK